MRGGRGDDRIGGDRRGRLGAPKAVGLLVRRADREARAASAAYLQDADLRAVDVDQLGDRADVVQLHPLVRLASFLAAFQGNDAEGMLLAQAVRDQVEVARLENLE